LSVTLRIICVTAHRCPAFPHLPPGSGGVVTGRCRCVCGADRTLRLRCS
jgi:hypothetical protein